MRVAAPGADMACSFEAAVDRWLDTDVVDSAGYEEARQDLVDTAGCSRVVHPRLLAEWLSREPGDRSGVATFEIEAFPPMVWAAVDGVVLATPVTLPSGPHLVQLGNIGTDQPIHAAILDLLPGESVTWVIADENDSMRIYTCNDLDPWLDGVESAAIEDARALLGLASALRRCPAFDKEMLLRWSKLVLRVGGVEPEPKLEAGKVVAADDPARWRRMKRTAAWGHLAVPFIVAGAGLSIYQIPDPQGMLFEQGDPRMMSFSGAALVASLAQAAAQRPVGAAPTVTPGALGLMRLALSLEDTEESPIVGMSVVTTAALTQWVLNEIAWARFLKRERQRKLNP